MPQLLKHCTANGVHCHWYDTKAMQGIVMHNTHVYVVRIFTPTPQHKYRNVEAEMR